MATIASPTRRVLGTKDPNAPLQQQTWKGPDRSVHVDHSTSHSVSRKRPLSPSISPAASPRTGQKRKIEQVDEAEQPDSQDAIGVYPLSQGTDMLSGMDPDKGECEAPVLTHSKSTLNSASSSCQGSQEEPARVDPEFHIIEEPSQQTLDSMVGCP
jgi:hypothetical protein